MVSCGANMIQSGEHIQLSDIAVEVLGSGLARDQGTDRRIVGRVAQVQNSIGAGSATFTK